MPLEAIKQFRHREVLTALRSANAAARTTSQTPVKVPNPFLPRKNPDTGRWAPAKYSLRRQADLIKKAKQSNALHLLPAGPKLPLKELQAAMQAVPKETEPAEPIVAKQEQWQAPVEWEGEVKERKVPGADVGNRLYAGKWRMFKGHKWQRTEARRTKKKEQMLQTMKGRIMRFQAVRLSCILKFGGCEAHVFCDNCSGVQAQAAKPSQSGEVQREESKVAVLTELLSPVAALRGRCLSVILDLFSSIPLIYISMRTRRLKWLAHSQQLEIMLRETQ